MKTQISPSLLSADFTKLGAQMKLLESLADSWHFDVMDGHFVPNISVGVPVLKSIRKATSLPIVAHLMIEHPEDYVDVFAKAGADVIEFHIETTPEPKKLLERIHGFGKKAGIALNPDTSLNMVTPYLDKLDLVLLMSVNPGFAGQGFIDITEKIKELRSSYKGSIEVDGGINKETAQLVYAAGANIIVSGSYIFCSEDPVKTIKDLREGLK